MALVTIEEAKKYLRVDFDYDDAVIASLLDSAVKLSIDVARLTNEDWLDIDSEKEFTKKYPREEIRHIRNLMRLAILYTTSYLYEHREEADHHELTLTLRAMLESIRGGAF